VLGAASVGARPKLDAQSQSSPQWALAEMESTLGHGGDHPGTQRVQTLHSTAIFFIVNSVQQENFRYEILNYFNKGYLFANFKHQAVYFQEVKFDGYASHCTLM
jgi:hypothetical protein